MRYSVNRDPTLVRLGSFQFQFQKEIDEFLLLMLWYNHVSVVKFFFPSSDHQAYTLENELKELPHYKF